MFTMFFTNCLTNLTNPNRRRWVRFTNFSWFFFCSIYVSNCFLIMCDWSIDSFLSSCFHTFTIKMFKKLSGIQFIELKTKPNQDFFRIKFVISRAWIVEQNTSQILLETSQILLETFLCICNIPIRIKISLNNDLYTVLHQKYNFLIT